MLKYLKLTLCIYDTDLVECYFVIWSLPAGYAWDLEQKSKNKIIPAPDGYKIIKKNNEKHKK